MCLLQVGAPAAKLIEAGQTGMKEQVSHMPMQFLQSALISVEAPDENTPDTVLALIMVCSQTSYVACVPLQGKSQLDLTNRELVQFTQRLGHSEVIFRCDNEPAILQLQRLATKTRQAMGLKTRMTSSVAYDHGNASAENAIACVRSLACSLMHHLDGRLGIQLSTSSALWSWALRHAAFLVSRFSVINGATPFQLAFGRQFSGALCEYGEPVFAFIHPGTKATPKWRRALFLGKSEDQNSFVLFDGQAVVLSKNVKRIQTTWRSHMAYCLMVPVTPPPDYVELESPRLPASTRPHDGDENESSKRARVEEAKKQRINRLKQEYEDRISAVKIEYKEYFTMDDYSTDLDVENGLEEEQVIGLEKMKFN